MSWRADFLALTDGLRAIPSEGDIDVRTVRILVRTRTWSTGKIQAGTATVADLEILPRPHVRGHAGDPVLRVEWITPSYGGGGYTPQQLNPSDAPGVEFYYVAIGPTGAAWRYALVDLDTTAPLHFTLNLKTLDRKLPF